MPEQKPNQPNAPEQQPKGRRICSWCKKYMGSSGVEGNTHGICKECHFEHFPDMPWEETEDKN